MCLVHIIIENVARSKEMKQSAVIITTIALALVSQFTIAGSITDTYTAGDTVSTSTFDNIKTAVNGNAGDVSTNTSSIIANAGDVSTNTSNITINAGNAALNASSIITNAASNTSNASRISDLEGTGANSARTTVTVVVETSVGVNNFSCLTASCPASHPIAIGGGVDPSNVFSMVVTQSSPGINGTRLLANAAGTYTNDFTIVGEWRGCTRNNSTTVQSMNVAVICSDK